MSSDIMEQVPTAPELARLARHADKYDTVRALGTATYFWLVSAIERDEIEASATLLGVAYTFRHAKLFSRIGNDIVLHCLVPTCLAVDDGPDELPAILRKSRIRSMPTISLTACHLVAIEDLRSRTIREMGKWIDDKMSSEMDEKKGGPSGSSCHCDIQAKRSLAIFRHLKRVNLWPSSVLDGLALKDIFDAAKSLALVDMPTLCGGRHSNRGNLLHCDGHFLITPKLMAYYFTEKASALEVRLNACLECVQADTLHFEGPCDLG